MTTRFRSVSVAAVALVVGVGLATAGCGKYSLGSLKAKKAFKDANAAVHGPGLEGGRRPVRRGAEERPELPRGAVLPGEQLRQPLQAGPQGRSRERRLHAEGHRALPDGRGDGTRTRQESSRCSTWWPPTAPDKLNDPPRPSRRQADDRDGAERADQLLRALEALRGRRPLRRSRAGPPQGARKSSRTTRWSTRRCRATTTARATSRRRSRTSRRRRSSSQESSGLPPDRDVLRGEGPQGLPADAARRRRTTRSRASRPRTRRSRSTPTTSTR